MPNNRKPRSDKGKSKYSPEQKVERRQLFRQRASDEATRRKTAQHSHKGRYTSAEIEQFTLTPREQLKPYQRDKVGKLPHEKVAPADIARHTGISEETIQKIMRYKFRGGVDPDSLVYIPSRGFFGRTINDKQAVVLRVTRNVDDPDDITIAFATAKETEKAIRSRSGCMSPPHCTMDGSMAEIVIPLKNKEERSNIA